MIKENTIKTLYRKELLITIILGFSIGLLASYPLYLIILLLVFGLAYYFLIFPKNGVILYLLVIALIYPTLRNIIVRVSTIPGPVLSVWQELGIFLLLSAGLLVSKKKRVDLNWLDFIVLMVFSLSFYGAIVSQDAVLSIYGFRLTYLPICFYFIVRLLHYNHMEVNKFITSLITISFLTGVVGIVFYFVFPDLYFDIEKSISGVVGEYYGVKRMASIFWTPVVFGSLMALNAVISFALITSREEPSFTKKIMLISGFFVFCFCLARSMSRGAWIFAGIGIFIQAILYKRSIGFLVLCIGILFIVFHFYSPHPFYGALKSGISPDSKRYELAQETIKNIKEVPFGAGLGHAGHIASYFAETNRRERLKTGATDSWYLKIGVETGIWSLGLFLLFMVIALLFAYKAYLTTKFPKLTPIYLGILTSFIGFSAQGIGSNVWDFYMVAPIFWVLLGFVGSYKSINKNDALYNNR